MREFTTEDPVARKTFRFSCCRGFGAMRWREVAVQDLLGRLARRLLNGVVDNNNDLTAVWRHWPVRKTRAQNGKGVGGKCQNKREGENRRFHNYHVQFASFVPNQSIRTIFAANGINARATSWSRRRPLLTLSASREAGQRPRRDEVE